MLRYPNDIKIESRSLSWPQRQLHNLLILELNFLEYIKISLIKIQKLFSDPAQAINGMNIYQKTSAQVVKDFADLRNIISDKNISFDSKDYGYLIVNII